MFDADGDGTREHVAWAGADDGLLVFDYNDDGDITNTDEVSFLSYLEGAKTDLEGLRGLDSNQDNVLNADDESWSLFKIWNDADLDGDVDEGELFGLDDLGIAEFSLESDGNLDIIGDIIEHGKSSYTKTDGSVMEFSDAEFVYEDGDFDVINLEEYTSGPDGDEGYGSPDLTEEDVVDFYENNLGHDYFSDAEYEEVNGTVDSFISDPSVDDVNTIIINFEHGSS